MKKHAEKLLKENKITAEEYRQLCSLSKKASAELLHAMSSPTRQIFKDLLTGAGLASLVGLAGADVVNRIISERRQRKAYEEMTKKVPILSEFPEEQVKDYYEIIRTFSPKAASNPIVAGNLVNKMIQFGGADHKLIQDLVSMEGPKKDLLSELALKSAVVVMGGKS